MGQVVIHRGGGGPGTVTSVAQTVPSFLSVAGSPITTSGTLAITLATQAANLAFAGPSAGAAAAPTFRSLVANDIPVLTLASAKFANQGTTTQVLHGNAAGNPSWSAVALAADVSGTLPVANGGTGVASATAFAVLCGGTTTTNPFQSIAGLGTSGQVLTSNGAGLLPTFQAAAGGGTALSGITAATAANTIASGVNSGQVWNWALTADSVTCMTFGETAAATGGTSTAGVPNQVLGKFTTLAASTMSPLSVYSRGSHVFSVSPTTPQILVASGSSSVPSLGFTGDSSTGIFFSGGKLAISNFVTVAFFGSNQITVRAGSPGTPAISDFNVAGNSGFWFDNNILGISVGNVENSQFIAGAFQLSKGSADAVSYAINSRKARGTVASPTVITTGDDLLTLSGYGYVGATNTYQEATRITADSNGTVSDVVGGLGGVLRFLTRTPAAVSLVERFTIDNNAAASETALLISVAGAAAIRASVGANDSESVGFRNLRVPNA